MRVLLTGAAGFLGSHLADALVADGHSVFGIDNLCTGSLRNLEHLKRDPRFEFLEHDICQPFDPGHVDYVLNFASPASPVDYYRLAIETLMVVQPDAKLSGDCEKVRGKVPACLYLGVLRRPVGASSNRGVLGHVNPSATVGL